MIRKMMLVLCAVLLIGSVASAANKYWVGNPAGGDWADANNWALTAGGAGGAGMPTTGDYAYMSPKAEDWVGVFNDPLDANNTFKMTQTAESWYNWTNQIVNVSSATDAFYRYRMVDGNAITNALTRATLNILDGGSLTMTSEFKPARYNYVAQDINQYDGSSVSAASLEVSYRGYRGIYNMYGGTATIAGALSIGAACGWNITEYLGDITYDDGLGGGPVAHVNADGDLPYTMAEARVNLFGGTMSAGTISFTVPALGSTVKGIIDLAGGTLILTGDQTVAGTNLMNGIANGNVIAYGGTQSVVATYDSITNKTTVVPEPMTMLMLGLGSVLAIRRRK